MNICSEMHLTTQFHRANALHSNNNDANLQRRFLLFKNYNYKTDFIFFIENLPTKASIFLLQVLIIGQTLEKRAMDLKRTEYCSFLPLYSLSTSPFFSLAMSSFSPNHLETIIDY